MVTQRYLHATDKCREMAGLVAAKFVTRPDNVQRHLPQLIDWTLTVRQWRSCEPGRVSECELRSARDHKVSLIGDQLIESKGTTTTLY